MTKKKRKYFVGGAVNTGLSSAGQAVGLNQGASNYLGNVGQLATGAATGNPQDIIGGATSLLTSGWGTAIDTFKNKDASVGQKALAAYGAINPMASIFSSGITDKLAQQKADEDEFNSLIKNRMANGGNIPRQTTNEFQEYSNQPMQPMVPRQANVPVQQPEFNYIPYRQDVSMSPMVSNNTLLDASNMPTPEADLRVRGLRENLYNNMMTNEYDGVPRSIPRGQRINPELVMAARNEDARNQAIKNYMDSSLWTQQKTNGDLQSIMTDPAFGQIQKLPDQKKDGGPLVEFNGNSHEDGGIAITPQDEVEGGETMLNNYIFSDTLKVDKELLKGTGLPDNLSGKTFAAASKLLSKELEDRPDDEITKETTDIFLNNLMNMNEVSRINKEQAETNELKCGGVKKYDVGGERQDLINQLQQQRSYLSEDPRNFMERTGDNIYQSYMRNKPALFQDFPITDIFQPGIEYLTGNVPTMTDISGNPIQGGMAFIPSMKGGSGYKNIGKNMQRNIPKQTFTPLGKSTFTKGAKKAINTKKPIPEFDLNYDPLKGGKKASPEVIKQRKQATKLSNLEKARAAKKEKAYQKLLDESGKAKSGLNIDPSLEGTLDFGKVPRNNLNINPNITRNIAQAGILGGLGLGAASLLDSEEQPQKSNNSVNTGEYSMEKINPYVVDNSILSANPILADIEAANALQQSNAVSDNTQASVQQSQQPNRWSIDNVLQYATTPEERQMALENFSRRGVGDWRRDANSQGFELGADGIPKQSVQGRFAGGVTPEHLRMLYPELANQVAPDGSNEWSDEQINQFQAAYQEANKGQNMELNPDNPTSNIIGGDWLRGSDMQRRPDVSIPEIPGGTIQTDTVDLGREVNSDLMPVPDKQYSIKDNHPPERGPMDMSWLRFAPVANALIPPPELEQYNPSTISAGYLKPEMVDEQTMRASMDAAQRGNIGALANVSGGSGAAQRAGLLGSGANYAGAVGNAFMQANQANNQATQQANQFNIGTQANIAGQNQQALNQADLFNTQNQNRWNEERRKLWSEGLESLGNIGQEEWAKKMYDTSSLMTTGATGPGGFINSGISPIQSNNNVGNTANNINNMTSNMTTDNVVDTFEPQTIIGNKQARIDNRQARRDSRAASQSRYMEYPETFIGEGGVETSTAGLDPELLQSLFPDAKSRRMKTPNIQNYGNPMASFKYGGIKTKIGKSGMTSEFL